MSTFLANSGNIESKWYIIDADGTALGRTASVAASLLRGKHKPTFTPNVNCGDHVIIINTDKAVLTGKKLEQKFHRHHSGYVGGLKETKYSVVMDKNSDKAMYWAVKGMLPKGPLGSKMLKSLRVFKGNEHSHAAQQPVAWKV